MRARRSDSEREDLEVVRVGAAEQEAHHLELELAARALRQHLEAHRAARVVAALVDGRVAAAGGAELAQFMACYDTRMGVKVLPVIETPSLTASITSSAQRRRSPGQPR